MLWVDLLLKMWGSGVEIAAGELPYKIRPTDKLLEKLPPNLREALNLLKNEKEKSYRSHRFWAALKNNGNIPYQKITHDDGSKERVFGKVEIEVKDHCLQRNPATGKFENAKVDHNDQSSEARFAKGITENWDELAEYYPILWRLEEFFKLAVMMRELRKIRSNNKAKMDFQQSRLSNNAYWSQLLITITQKKLSVLQGVVSGFSKTLSINDSAITTAYNNSFSDNFNRMYQENEKANIAKYGIHAWNRDKVSVSTQITHYLQQNLKQQILNNSNQKIVEEREATKGYYYNQLIAVRDNDIVNTVTYTKIINEFMNGNCTNLANALAALEVKRSKQELSEKIAERQALENLFHSSGFESKGSINQIAEEKMDTKPYLIPAVYYLHEKGESSYSVYGGVMGWPISTPVIELAKLAINLSSPVESFKQMAILSAETFIKKRTEYLTNIKLVTGSCLLMASCTGAYADLRDMEYKVAEAKQKLYEEQRTYERKRSEDEKMRQNNFDIALRDHQRQFFTQTSAYFDPAQPISASSFQQDPFALFRWQAHYQRADTSIESSREQLRQKEATRRQEEEAKRQAVEAKRQEIKKKQEEERKRNEARQHSSTPTNWLSDISTTSIPVIRGANAVGAGLFVYSVGHAVKEVVESDNPVLEAGHQGVLLAAGMAAGYAATPPSLIACAGVGAAFPFAAPVSVPACTLALPVAASVAGGVVADALWDSTINAKTSYKENIQKDDQEVLLWDLHRSRVFTSHSWRMRGVKHLPLEKRKKEETIQSGTDWLISAGGSHAHQLRTMNHPYVAHTTRSFDAAQSIAINGPLLEAIRRIVDLVPRFFIQPRELNFLIVKSWEVRILL